MKMPKPALTGIAGLALLALLPACAGQMKNLARTYESEQLRPVIVGDRAYAVEKRTRDTDPDKGNRVPGNRVVSVLANVDGTWVYCGLSRDDCAEAIRRHKRPPSRRERM